MLPSLPPPSPLPPFLPPLSPFCGTNVDHAGVCSYMGAKGYGRNFLYLPLSFAEPKTALRNKVYVYKNKISLFII